MSSPQLTHETYSDFVASHDFAVVHCWAAWNGYDHQMRAALADQMPHFPEIAFAEFDVDPTDHHDICRDLNVHGPPFLALYRDGVLVTTRVGLMERADLQAFLDGLLNPAA